MESGKAYRNRQLSRRRVLQGTALTGAGLAAASMLGCGRAEQPVAPPSRPTVRQPKRGGIISHQAGGPIAQDVTEPLDPHTASPRLGITLRLVYQALLGYHLTSFGPEPDLVQSWEQPSRTEYVLKLSPGVKWHNKPPANGRELTAQDVIFSLNRVRTNEGRFINRAVLASMDKIEAVSKDTVRITTKAPDASFLLALAADPCVVLAPEVVERARNFVTVEEVVGTGAFIMKSLQQEVAAEYVRNPDYFKPGLPYLDGVRTVFFSDPQAAFAALQGGKLDIARVPGSQAKRFSEAPAANTKTVWWPDDSTVQNFPNTRERPYDDRRVQRALRLLIDHAEFVSAWAEPGFGGGRFGSIFAGILEAWDLPQEEYSKSIFWKQPKDEAVREALTLLNAAGFSRSDPLRFDIFTSNTGVTKSAAELLEARYRQLGQGTIETQIKLYDGATADSLAARRDFRYFVLGNGGATPDPGTWLNQLWRSNGGRNYAGWSDARADEMIDRVNTIFDVQQRKTLVRDVVRYMMENSPSVTFAVRTGLNAVNAKLQDYTGSQFMNGRQFQWVWLDA